jgi:AcrR family transcriptional regulator
VVLTIRPLKGADDGFGDAQRADRLGVRRAALELMADRGFSGVTVDNIVARAGISRRTFFRLFAGKHQVVSCDHGIYYAEVCDFLSRHDSERTLARSAEAAGLISESLSAVREQAQLRERIIASDDALVAEENRWFALYQESLAEFLTQPQGVATTLEAEMLAASIIAAVRVTMRDWLADPSISAITRFRDGIRTLQAERAGSPTRRTIAVVETELTVDELVQRLRAQPQSADTAP